MRCVVGFQMARFAIALTYLLGKIVAACKKPRARSITVKPWPHRLLCIWFEIHKSLCINKYQYV